MADFEERFFKIERGEAAKEEQEDQGEEGDEEIAGRPGRGRAGVEEAMEGVAKKFVEEIHAIGDGAQPGEPGPTEKGGKPGFAIEESAEDKAEAEERHPRISEREHS